jgi:iron complex transport system substrate-binding protein
MLKRFMPIVLALVLASSLALGSLAACQGDTDNTGTDSANTSGTNSDANSAGGNGTGSASTATAPGPVTFTDDLGNVITVNNPQRVVATMGSFASAWELAGGKLVGASDDAFADYQLSSEGIEKIGDFSNLNQEVIIALDPDFVIMTGASGGRGGSGATNQLDMKEGLENSGITVAYFKVTVFEDYLRMLKVFTDITGRADLYQQYGQQVQDDINAIKAQVPAGATKPRVLLMTTYSGGTMVQNSSTQTGAMLAELGVNNLADENPSLLKDFSLEAVIEADPDFIFVVPMGNDTAAATKNLQEATAANPAWATLSAVQNGHYITLDPKLYQYKPNQNWAAAYQGLFDELYK